jgi:hypothetical protein
MPEGILHGILKQEKGIRKTQEVWIMDFSP